MSILMSNAAQLAQMKATEADNKSDQNPDEETEQ